MLLWIVPQSHALRQDSAGCKSALSLGQVQESGRSHTLHTTSLDRTYRSGIFVDKLNRLVYTQGELAPGFGSGSASIDKLSGQGEAQARQIPTGGVVGSWMWWEPAEPASPQAALSQ